MASVEVVGFTPTLVVEPPAIVPLARVQEVLEAVMAICSASVPSVEPLHLQALHVMEEGVRRWEEQLQLLAQDLAHHEESLAVLEHRADVGLDMLLARRRDMGTRAEQLRKAQRAIHSRESQLDGEEQEAQRRSSAIAERVSDLAHHEEELRQREERVNLEAATAAATSKCVLAAQREATELVAAARLDAAT